MKGNNKPYDAEVEYVERVSDDADPIDSGYVPQGDDIDIFCTLSISVFGEEENSKFISAYTDSSHNRYEFSQYNTFTNYLRIYHGSNRSSQVSKFELSTIYEVQIYGKSREAYVNGVQINLREYDDTDNINTLVYFVDRSMRARLYDFRLVKAGKTIMDIIPVRIQDNGFLYDRVRHRLMGDGKLAVGPDVNQ